MNELRKKGSTGQEEEYFEFIDDLRDSGKTNMFGAAPYLRQEFGLTKNESYDVLAAWMRAFEK